MDDHGHQTDDHSQSGHSQFGQRGANRVTADIDALRELITRAKSMPMSASCIVNRTEALELVERIAGGLPDELAEARGVLDGSRSQIAQAEAEANQIIERAREQAAELAGHTSIVQQAEEIAAKLVAESQTEAAELRVETDAFIDERMASFESVLQKTASQVKTARGRLSARSHLDGQS